MGIYSKPILKKTKSKYLDEEEDAKYPIISHRELEAIQLQKLQQRLVKVNCIRNDKTNKNFL